MAEKYFGPENPNAITLEAMFVTQKQPKEKYQIEDWKKNYFSVKNGLFWQATTVDHWIYILKQQTAYFVLSIRT